MKIAVGNVVEYKLRKGESFGKTTKGTITATVNDIDQNGEFTTAKLVDGTNELIVSYHRSRFTVTKTKTRVFFRAKDGELTKKERALGIVREVRKAKGSRADAIARFKTELNLGPAGASTYYQNIKSGRWS